MSPPRFEFRAPTISVEDQRKLERFRATLKEHVESTYRRHMRESEALARLTLWPVPVARC